MLDRAGIASLIPHQGAMCLIERVLEWDAGHVIAATRTHAWVTHPLASAGRLRAVHACEYGGQAAALHGGLAAQAAGQRATPGVVVALREVRFGCDYLEDLGGEIIVEARRLMASSRSWQYSFRLEHAGAELASGRITVMARPDLAPILRPDLAGRRPARD